MHKKPARKKPVVKVLCRLKQKPAVKTAIPVERQIKNLTQAVTNLASAFSIELSSVQSAVSGTRGLRQAVGDHVMIDLLQQAMAPEIKLTVEDRWNRMINAVESAIEEYNNKEKPDWSSSEDIHKIIQYINGHQD
jgi:hypothetical protein